MKQKQRACTRTRIETPPEYLCTRLASCHAQTQSNLSRTTTLYFAASARALIPTTDDEAAKMEDLKLQCTSPAMAF